VDSGLTNYPLYVKIAAGSDIGSVAQSDGDDIRFFLAVDVTTLPCEKVTFRITKVCPLGSDKFISKVEMLLGRRLRALPVGRPQKKIVERC
jgi:hypothetical protein